MITLILPFPPSVNRLWRTKAIGGMYRSKEYSDWRTHALWSIAGQAKGQKLPGAYTLVISAVRPDKRRRDIGNLEKAVSDILQAAGVITDDCLCEDLRLRWVASGPECLVQLEEFKP
jgi:Holliday junction resolvase RusA-like endonuclease